MVFDKDLQSVQEARELVKKAKKAQAIFASFSQQKIDEIIANIALMAASEAVPLAKMAQQETGFGNWEDKVLKNVFASTRVYDHIKNIKTIGIISNDQDKKVMEVGVPLGVIVALVPSTNPTSTIFYKTLIALKSGNAIIFSSHPKAQKCSRKAIEVVKQAAENAGAPEGIIDGVKLLTLQATEELMHSRDVSLILATGGEAMVKAAYNSGTPTISGGPGNGPAFIERSADIKQAVQDIITSKTFDNGVICASEQSIIVEQCIEAEVREELLFQGAYFMNKQESEKVALILLRPNGMINPEYVGKTAQYISENAGFIVPASIRVLISLQDSVARNNVYAREKLCPVLALYIEQDWLAACKRVEELLSNEGRGHTLVIHSKNEEIIKKFALQKPVFRLLVNTPASLGGIGATTNLAPALTLGCGALGGGSSSDNVGPLNLLNIRKVGYGVRSIDDLRQPKTSSSHQVTINNQSIFEDLRFTSGEVSVSSSTEDQRFSTLPSMQDKSALDEISEESVELILKQMMGRFDS